MMRTTKTKSGIVVLMTTLTAIVVAAATSIILTTQSAYAFTQPWVVDRSESKAPIATSDNNVYVVWWGNGTGNWEVMFKASNDGGQTFGERINLSNSTNGTSGDADVAAVGDNVYVAYWDNKTGVAATYLRVSTDAGQTFGPEVALADSADTPPVITPERMAQYQEQRQRPIPDEIKVAASGNNVYVIATTDEGISTGFSTGPTPLEVFFKVSNDNGQTFGEAINLSNSTGIESNRVEIEASGDNVYVTWWDKVDGRDQPMMRVSNDAGQTFGEAMVLTANATTPSS